MAETTSPGEEHKNKGNAFFSEGKWGRAFQCYTAAINADPNNYIYYGNRCACLLKLSKDARALEDAEKCIQLKPDWPKGHFRKGVALSELLRHSEAILSINVGLSLILSTNAPTTEMTSKLKEIVERIELNQDKNFIKVADIPTLLSQEDYGAYVAKMKVGNPVTLTPEQIWGFFDTCWTGAMARLQACPSDAKRRPFVYFHTGYAGEGSTGLIPLIDNMNMDLVGGLMKRLANDLKLQFIITVAIKSNSTGLPFERNPKSNSWTGKKKDGVFIQLDSKGKSCVYFIPIGTRKKGIFTFAKDQLEELDKDVFKIIPIVLDV